MEWPPGRPQPQQGRHPDRRRSTADTPAEPDVAPSGAREGSRNSVVPRLRRGLKDVARQLTGLMRRVAHRLIFMYALPSVGGRGLPSLGGHIDVGRVGQALPLRAAGVVQRLTFLCALPTVGGWLAVPWSLRTRPV